MIHNILISQETKTTSSENAPKTKAGECMKSNENCQKCVENVS